MRECICNNCINLKNVVNDEGMTDTYECEFGFPSEECVTCETGECELTCSHFAADEEKMEPRKVQCVGCGKELEQVCADGEEGEVYCVACYLKGR